MKFKKNDKVFVIPFESTGIVSEIYVKNKTIIVIVIPDNKSYSSYHCGEEHLKLIDNKESSQEWADIWDKNSN